MESQRIFRPCITSASSATFLMKLTAVFEPCAEGGYACWLEEIPEAVSQGDTLEEARSNLRDALALVMEQRREEAREAMSAAAFEEELVNA